MLLVALLAVLGVGVLIHLLVTSIRGRRRDLAILKSIGFARRQVRATVGWQSTALGDRGARRRHPTRHRRRPAGWLRFAAYLGAATKPAVPLVPFVVIPIATLVMAIGDRRVPGADRGPHADRGRAGDGMTGLAWYRFRSTFRRRFGGYLALVLLVGLMGGLAMGAIGAARRTQSSFPAFLAGTNPSDVSLLAGDLSLPGKLATLPHVTKVETVAVLNVVPLGRDGSPLAAASSGKVIPIGSLDGLLFDQDRVTVTKGRMADRGRADEFVTIREAARLFGLRVGDVVPFGVYTNEQAGDLVRHAERSAAPPGQRQAGRDGGVQ